MPATTIETSSFSLTLDLPERASSAMKIDAFVSFLTSSDLGTDRLTWDTSQTQTQTFISLTATRTPRPTGAYYRDPYPLTLALELPALQGTPSLRITVPPTDVVPLVSALRNYANTLRYQK
jgi:hypothetical protein